MHHRVFVVEDHPIMLEAYEQVFDFEPELELCGTARTVEGAIERLKLAPCDLVVTDLVLPGRDGIELVGHLRSARPDLPVIVITGHHEEAFEQRAYGAGAAGFLSKHTLVDTLVPTIRRVLDERAAAGAAPGEA